MIRQGWGKRVLEDIKNEKFDNTWKSLDLPSSTLCKSRSPVILINGIQRELTLDESKLLQGFPNKFIFTNKIKAYSLIGNSVPPLFMKALAEHVRDKMLG